MTAVALAAGTLAACGDDSGGGQLTVSAAASLKPAFEDYAASFDGADVRFSFAGSDELAAQVRRGARPDLIATANAQLPRGLFRAGIVNRPLTFARGELVIATPADTSEIRSLDDLAGEGVRLVIGDPDVPIGAYTRAVLDRLPASRRQAILANVRSEEPDVLGIVAKLTRGAASAGLLYATDVQAADGELRAIRLPRRLAPEVRYAIAAVKGTAAERGARLFIEGLLAGEGRRALRAAGFLAPRRAGSP